MFVQAVYRGSLGNNPKIQCPRQIGPFVLYTATAERSTDYYDVQDALGVLVLSSDHSQVFAVPIAVSKSAIKNYSMTAMVCNDILRSPSTTPNHHM